eukprot:Em0019g856a
MPSAEEKAWRVGERSLSLASAVGNSTLEFDRVFNDSVGHETFFEQAVAQELSGVLEGHNVFIAAYGLPCTGKTHTIFGTTGQTRVKQEARGVIIRCGQQLFDILQRPENAGLACRITVTFCHLFENGRVADLFDAKKRSLNVVEKGTSGMPLYEVEGLTEQVVTSPQDVLRLVEKGYLMRNASGCLSETAGGGTHGKVSLRGNAPLQQYRQHNSHAIFKFTAETVNGASPGEATVASVIVVDLAGLGIEKLLSGATCTDVGIEAMHQLLRSLAANRIGEGNLSALSGTVEEIKHLKTQLLQKLGSMNAADADKCEVTQEGACVIVHGTAQEQLSTSCQDIAKQIATLESGIIKGGVVSKPNDKHRKGPTMQGTQPMVRPSWQPPQAQNLPAKAKQGLSKKPDTVHKPAAEPTRTVPHPESFGPHPLDAPMKSPLHQLLKGSDSHQGPGFGSGNLLAQQDDTSSSDDSDSDSGMHKPKATPPTGVPPPPLVGIPHIAPDAGVRPPRPASGATKPVGGPNSNTPPLLPLGSTAILKQTPQSLSAVPKESNRNEQPLAQPMVPMDSYSNEHSNLPNTNGAGEQTPKHAKGREKHAVQSGSGSSPITSPGSIPPNPSSIMPPNSSSIMPPNPSSNMPPNSSSNMPPNSSSIMPPNPSSNMPPNSSSNMPPNPSSIMPPNSSSNMPPNSSSNMPPNPSSNMPPNPSSNMPPNPSSIMPPNSVIASSLTILPANSNHHPQGTQPSEATSINHHPQGTQPSEATSSKVKLKLLPEVASASTHKVLTNQPATTPNELSPSKDPAVPLETDIKPATTQKPQDQIIESVNPTSQMKPLADIHTMQDPYKSSPRKLRQLDNQDRLKSTSDKSMSHKADLVKSSMKDLSKLEEVKTISKQTALEANKPTILTAADLSGPHDEVKLPSIDRTKSSEQHHSSINDQGKPSINDQGKPSTNDQGKPSINDQGKPSINDQGKPSINDQGKPSVQLGIPVNDQIKPLDQVKKSGTEQRDQVKPSIGEQVKLSDQPKTPTSSRTKPLDQVNPTTVKQRKHLREKPTSNEHVKFSDQSQTPTSDQVKHFDQVKPPSTKEATETSTTEQRNQSADQAERPTLNRLPADQEKQSNNGGVKPAGVITGFQNQSANSSDSPTTDHANPSTKLLVTDQTTAQKDQIHSVEKDNVSISKEPLKSIDHQVQDNGKIELNSDQATGDQVMPPAEGVGPATQKVQGQVSLSNISTNKHVQLDKPSSNNQTKPLANDLIKSPVADQVKSPITDQVKSPITDQVKSSITDQVKSSITDQVKSSITEQVKSSITEQVNLPMVELPIANQVQSPINDHVKSQSNDQTKLSINDGTKLSARKEFQVRDTTNQSNTGELTLPASQPESSISPISQLKPAGPIPKPMASTPQSESTGPTTQPRPIDPTLQPKPIDPNPHQSDQPGLRKRPITIVSDQTGHTSELEMKELQQHTLNLGPEVHTAADISSGETSTILAPEMDTPLTSTPKHSTNNRRPLDGGGTPTLPSMDERGLPAPPSLPSIHPKRSLLPAISPPGSSLHHLQEPHLPKAVPPQPSALPQPVSSPAHLQIMPPAVSMPISPTRHQVSLEPAQARAALLRAAPPESDSDDVSSTTDSESEQIRPKAKSTGGQSATKRQSTARLPLYDAPLQNDPGPSSPSLLPLPPHVMMVEMQHPGSSAPLHAPPPRNELPTYEQLEASFNSVHSGTGRMFQAAALEVQQQQYTGPEAPPMGDSMADYLSTQEIHTKAMEGTKSSIMMSLVTQCGVDYMDHGGRTPLMYAVLGNQPRMCELLLGLGASVNLTDYTGASSILWATYQSKLEVMKILLRYGADISAQDPDGLTLFHWAVKSPNVQCLKLLCKYATPGIASIPSNEGLTPLHCAVMCNQPEHIKVLLSSTDASVKSKDGEGRTPLTYAVLVGSPQCIKAILGHNDDVINITDEQGRTPLHYACAEGSVDCLKMLLSYKKCNLHCQDNRGTSALHWAAAANHPTLVQLLLRRGADRALKDHDGFTALDHALQRGNRKCVEVLQSQPPLNRSNSMTSLVGPPLSLATTTPPTLDENGHVQMNVPRKMSLFGAQEGHMSRLPADGQAQIEGEQSSSPKPEGSQKTGPDPSCLAQSAQLSEREASVEQALGHRGRLHRGGWFLELCSCWTGRRNTVVPLDEPPAVTPNSYLPAIAT